jgi:hypothetical protein
MTTDKQKPLYVASRASLPERPALWRFLRANGWPIISTWIDEAGPGETASMSELWERIAGEVSQACGVVAFVDPSRDLPLKGALVEVGMALGQGKRVGLVCLSAEHPDTARRLGSWVEHPAVLVCDDFSLAREWVQAGPVPVVWDEAQRVCDLPAVDEAIRTLLEDHTGDNATCLVRVVLQSAASVATGPAGASPGLSDAIEAHARGVNAGMATAIALVEARMRGYSTALPDAGAAMVRKTMARYGEARAIRDAMLTLPPGTQLRAPDLPTAQEASALRLMAESFKGRADDCGRLARAVLGID